MMELVCLVYITPSGASEESQRTPLEDVVNLLIFKRL